MDVLTASSDAPEPIDTTGDPVLEAKWQALVLEVIDAKEAATAARERLVIAEQAIAKASLAEDPDEFEVHPVVVAHREARVAYEAAVVRVAAAAARMKAGDL
jgi:hypothetical protein